MKKSDYTYSNTNQLLKLVERMFDESNKEIARKTTKYTYDNNGNQLKQSISHTLPDNTGLRPKTTGTAYGDKLSDNSNSIDKLIEKTSYTYDGFNRLIKTETIKDGIRTTVDFTYNGDDLRVSKTTKKSNNNYTPEVTNYLYDRQNVILETDANSNVKERYIKGINYIAKTDSTGKETYFLFNGHGDLVQTVDESGTVQNQYDYDIWGNPVLTIETAPNAIRYTGEFYDEETGLYYLRARYYDPYLGRFTTEDSYWGEDNNPLSLNLYTYCHNDPIQYVDPTGHMTYKEMVLYLGKDNAEKYKHEADPDPTPKGITLKDEADITTWSNDSSKATFTVGGVKKELYIDKGIVYDSWGYERGTVIDGHITVSEYEFKNLFGGSSSPGSSSSRESTLTVNSWENITSVYVRDNVNATINNYGIIDTINTGKNSSILVNNTGIITDTQGDSICLSNAPNNSSNNALKTTQTSTNNTNKVSSNKSNTVNLTIDGIKISDAVVINGKTYASIEEVAKAIDPTAVIDKDNNKLTITNKDTGLRVTVPLHDKNYDNYLSVADIAKAAGVEDTLSWWGDKNGFNVLIQQDMNNAAVQVTRSGNTINVIAFVEFTGSPDDIFPGTTFTYAEVAAGGILSKWNKTVTGNQYDFAPGQKITINTELYSNQSTPNNLWKSAGTNQKDFLEIYIDNTNPTYYGPAGIMPIQYTENVPHMDGGQDNWSVNNDKKITMYRSHSGDPNEYGQNGYASTIAHEFGHVLGLGDAYGDKDKGRVAATNTPEVPVTKWLQDDIMANNGYVTPNDIEMVWQAWSTNKWQYFTDYKGHKKSEVIKSY